MDVLHYYELKQKYQEDMNKKKDKIKKNKGLSVIEKQAKFKKISMKCVQCDKPGGTIFDERNGMLKAVCGAKTPCDLNINIKRKLYDNMREVEQKNLKKSEGLKMRIIMTKLDYLFGLNSSKEEIVDKFNTLKNELAQLSESQLIIQKKYGDILTGVHREPLLADANLELINQIADLKKIYEEYLLDPSTGYLETMVEKYLTILKPLTEKIRNMNYEYYAIESNVEKGGKITMDGEGEGEGLGEGDGDREEKTAEEDTTKQKKAIYTLVALPYRLERLEQERK
jgi:hypothetical protein